MFIRILQPGMDFMQVAACPIMGRPSIDSFQHGAVKKDSARCWTLRSIIIRKRNDLSGFAAG
jgi:hypothetical protein